MANSDVSITITIDGQTHSLRTARSDVNELGRSITGTNSAANALRDSLGAMALAVGGVAALTAAFKSFAASGIEANRSFENLKIQLTGLIAANSSNVSMTGKTLDAHAKWNMGMRESESILKSLNQTNAKTKFTLEEITGAFNMFYATSAGQGDRNKAVRAMDSIALAAQATGKDLRALTPMMDSLATGTVIAASEMGSFMKIVGLTNEELKKASGEGKVYDYIIEKLAKFKELSAQAANGYDAALGSLKNELGELSRELSKPMFDTVTKGLSELAKLIKDNKPQIIEFGLDISRSFQLMGSGVIYLGAAVANVFTAIPAAVLLAIDAMSLKLENGINEMISGAEKAYNTIADLWGGRTTFDRADFATNLSAGLLEFRKNLEGAIGNTAETMSDLFDEIKRNTQEDIRPKALENLKDALADIPPVSKPASENLKKNAKDFSALNAALREIARIGMSEYEKKLDDINQKEREWIKNGVSPKDATAAKQKLFDILQTEEADKAIKEYKDFLNEKEAAQKEYFEAIGEHEKAWSIESAKTKEKIKKLELNEEEAKKYLEIQKKKYLEPYVKNSKTAFKDIKNSWADTVSSMQKTVDDGFFNFFIGKTKSLKTALKDIGANLMRDMISPYARALSQGISGGFGAFLGGGSNLASIASNLGLTKNDSGGWSGLVGGTAVELSSTGQILRGADALDKSATNLLSSVSNLQSAYSLLTGGYTNLISKFTTVPTGYLAEYLSSMGWTSGYFGLQGLGAGAQHALTGNILGGGGLNGALSGAYSGGYMAGAGLAGAGLGYGVGYLGDRLLGANTYASSIGAAGGALGGLASAGAFGAKIGSVAGPWGAVIGAVAGALIGGAFGKKKATGSGISALQDITAGDALSNQNIRSYVDMQKKGWFSKKSWTELSDLDETSMREIGAQLNSMNRLASRAGATSPLKLAAGKYSGESLANEGFAKAALRSMSSARDAQTQNALWKDWEERAKKANKKVIELMSESLGAIADSYKSLELLTTKNPIKQVEISMRQAFEGFTDAAQALKLDIPKELGSIADLSAEQMKAAYKKAISGDFAKQNVDSLNSLVKAYEAAKKAQDEYVKSLISFTQSIAQTQAGFYAAVGRDTNVLTLQNIYTKFRALAGSIEGDLGSERMREISKLGNANDPRIWAQYFYRMSAAQLQEFLSSGDAQMRKQLLEAVTEYKNFTTANGGREVWLKSLTGLEEIVKQIKALDLAKQAQKTLEAQKQQLSVLNLQRAAIEKLASTASKIRESVIDDQTAPINYALALQKAKAAFSAGQYDSKAYDELNSAVAKQEQNLRDSAATYQDYRYEMLRLANEVEGIGGEVNLSDLLEQIKKLDKLLNSANDTYSQQLDALKKQKAALELDSQNQINALHDLLGANSPIVAYLQAVKDAIMAGKAAPEYKGEASANVSNGATTANGALISSSLDRDINQIYLDILGRSVEQSGLDAWKRKAQIEGLSKERLRAQIEATARALTGGSSKQDYVEWSKKRGYKPFAEGGIVTRPTRALIGEAGYDEAVIPLDGRGIKVDMGGAFEALAIRLERVERIAANIGRDVREITMNARQTVENGAINVRSIA